MVLLVHIYCDVSAFSQGKKMFHWTFAHGCGAIIWWDAYREEFNVVENISQVFAPHTFRIAICCKWGKLTQE